MTFNLTLPKRREKKKSLTYTVAKISQLHTHLNIYSFARV